MTDSPVAADNAATQTPFGPSPVGRRTPWFAVVAVVAFAALFMAALPWYQSTLVQTRMTVAGETLPLQVSAVVAPEGWNIGIARAAFGVPALQKGDVQVDFRSGLWLGGDDSMLERIAEWYVEDAGGEATIPVASDRDIYDEEVVREVYLIESSGGNADGDVYVVRQYPLLVVMRVRGSEADLAEVDAEIQSMIDSLDLGEVGIDVERVVSLDDALPEWLS